MGRQIILVSLICMLIYGCLETKSPHPHPVQASTARQPVPAMYGYKFYVIQKGDVLNQVVQDWYGTFKTETCYNPEKKIYCAPVKKENCTISDRERVLTVVGIVKKENNIINENIIFPGMTLQLPPILINGEKRPYDKPVKKLSGKADDKKDGNASEQPAPDAAESSFD